MPLQRVAVQRVPLQRVAVRVQELVALEAWQAQHLRAVLE